MASSALAPKSTLFGAVASNSNSAICLLGNFLRQMIQEVTTEDSQDQSQDKVLGHSDVGVSRAGIERARDQSYPVFPPTREREVAWERFKDGKPPRTPFPQPTRVFVSTSLSNPKTTEHLALRARDRSQEGTLSRGVEARWTP